MTTYYIDPELGNDSTGNGTSGNPWKTTGGAGSLTVSNGDLFKIKKSPDPTLVGNATFTDGSATITLASAVTSNINMCEVAWTASTNVTTGANTTNRVEGTNSANFAIAAGFTTGKIAYSTTVNTDYSAYQQISFSITSTTTLTANTLTLSLCSDTTGDTAVNTFNIPAILVVNQVYYFTIDNAGALGSSIQSISLNAATDPGTVTVYLDNIIACKSVASADSLSLVSLVGKDVSGDKLWWAIKSINGTTVILNSYTVGSTGLYSGTSETTSLYKRETFKFNVVNANVNLVNFGLSSSTSGVVTIEGGYSSDWSAVTGVTFYDCVSFNGANSNGFTVQSGKNRISFKNFGFARVNNPFSIGGGWCSATNIYGTILQSIFATSTPNVFIFTVTDTYITTSLSGFGPNGYTPQVILTNHNARSCAYGLIPGHKWRVYGADIWRGTGIFASYNAEFEGYNFVFHNIAYSTLVNTSSDAVYFYNPSFQGTLTGDVSYAANTSGEVNFIDYNQTAGYNKSNKNGVIFENSTAVRHTAAGNSMKVTVPSSIPTLYPNRYKLGTIAVAASTTVGLTIWSYMSTTGMFCNLVVEKNTLLGISSDQTASASPGSATTWTQSGTLSVTPTSAGFIDVYIDIWGAAGTWYFDDFNIA